MWELRYYFNSKGPNNFEKVGGPYHQRSLAYGMRKKKIAQFPGTYSPEKLKVVQTQQVEA